MKIFVTQLIPLVFKKIFLKNKFLTGLSLLVLLFSMSLYAETHYLFPSDIINQSEPAIYKINRAHRYTTPHHWIYPEDIRTESWPVDKIPVHAPTYATQSNSSHSPSGVHHDPVEEYNNHFGRRIYKQSMKMNPITIPMNRGDQYGQRYPNLLYASDIEPDNRSTNQKNKSILYTFQNQGRQRHPNELYASDIEPGNRSNRQKKKPMLYTFQNQGGQAQAREQIRYIPVPAYRASRVLSDTIPDVITLGQSHLSSNYNYGGLINLFDTQYNPLTSLGIFPDQWEMFNLK